MRTTITKEELVLLGFASLVGGYFAYRLHKKAKANAAALNTYREEFKKKLDDLNIDSVISEADKALSEDIIKLYPEIVNYIGIVSTSTNKNTIKESYAKVERLVNLIKLNNSIMIKAELNVIAEEKIAENKAREERLELSRIESEAAEKYSTIKSIAQGAYSLGQGLISPISLNFKGGKKNNG